MRTLVTGAGGFIGRHLMAAIPGALPAPHHVIPGISLDGVELVIHAGRATGIGTDSWRLDQDPEYCLLTRLASHPARYMMLSTRAVYGIAGSQALRPTDPPAPVTPYGRNKLRLEQAARDLLGERLCILRLSNVFGFEWPGRATFFGIMLDGLKRDSVIRFDMAGSTRRDFIPVELAALTVARLTTGRQRGIVHVGAGLSLPCADLAHAVIQGFGSGRLLVESPLPKDEFAFDTRAAQAETGVVVRADDVLSAARQAGLALAAAR
jgi:nucleoside-diphosphate-sugar epimerase